MTASLKDALAAVEAALEKAIKDALPGDRDAEFWRRSREIDCQLAEQLKADLGARISTDFNGARVRIAGVSATCIAGLNGALRNWCAAARRRLEAGA